MTQICSIENCEKTRSSLGLCRMHYNRLKRHGDPLGGATYSNYGMSKTPEWHTWQYIKWRCHNPNNKDYAKYGAKGIVVCERWRNSFADFLSDMGPKPGANYSIDRINGSGNCEPSNCRWATLSEQSVNRSIPKNNTAGYRGISFHQRHGKWYARVSENGKLKHIGSFISPVDAAVAYDDAARKLYGAGAKLNFPARKLNQEVTV